jgi:hypothetical protein
MFLLILNTFVANTAESLKLLEFLAQEKPARKAARAGK